MKAVDEIVICDSDSDTEVVAAIVGGNEAYLDVWPRNPDGDELLLVMTIFCEHMVGFEHVLPLQTHQVVHVFSTYSRRGYFLENIAYDPDGEGDGSDGFTSGYTAVLGGDLSKSIKCESTSMPKRSVRVQPKKVEDDSCSTMSFFSTHTPKELLKFVGIARNYQFLCQLNSSDFPEPFQDVFYLTDAMGYVLIRKQNQGCKENVGEFFVLAS